MCLKWETKKTKSDKLTKAQFYFLLSPEPTAAHEYTRIYARKHTNTHTHTNTHSHKRMLSFILLATNSDLTKTHITLGIYQTSPISTDERWKYKTG